MDILAFQIYLKYRGRKVTDFLDMSKKISGQVIAWHLKSPGAQQGVRDLFDGFISVFQVLPQREIISLVICSDLYELSFKERFLHASVGFQINRCVVIMLETIHIFEHTVLDHLLM